MSDSRSIEMLFPENSRLCSIEEWFPGERLTTGLVQTSILQKPSDAFEVFTKE